MAPDRQKVIQAAEKLVARGRIQAAIDEYRKVLDRHPNDTSTLNRVGDLYARLNRMQEAVDLFQKTAESYGRQGFFVKAIAIYKKIIRLDPGQIRAYESLADLYNRQGLTGDSLAQYQVVADYYVKHGDTGSALGVYGIMVEIEPNNPTRRLHLAGMLQRAGRVPAALEQYYEIANLMLTHSRGEDALRVLEGALAIDAADLDFLRRALHGLEDAGFDRLGEQFLEAAVRINPQAHVLRLETRETTTPEVVEAETDVEVETDVEAEADVEVETDVEVQAFGVEAEPEIGPEIEIDIEIEATARDAEAEVVPELADGDEELIEVLEDELILEVEPADGGVDAAAPVEEVRDLDAPEAGQEFILDDIEPEPPAELVALAPESPAAGEALGFELDLDERELEDAIEADAEEEPATVAEESPGEPEIELVVPAEVEAGLEDEAPAEEEEPILHLAPPEPPEATPDERLQAVETAADDATEIRSAEPAPEAEPDRVLEEVVIESRGGRAAASRLGSEFEVSGESIKLLIEAEVLSRYGMDEMAITVLERILEGDARHAEAMARLVRLQLRAERTDEALTVANRLADLVRNVGAPKSWPEVCEALARCGFLLTEGRFVGELTPGPVRAEAETTAAVELEPGLEESVEEEVEAIEAPAAQAEAEPVSVEYEPVAESAPAEPAADTAAESSIEELVAETASRERHKPHRLESTEDVLADVIDEIERETPAADREAGVAAPAAGEEEPPVSAEEIEEEWLRELEREGLGSRVLEPPIDEFVDLATELEAELIEEGGLDDELLPGLREQSLEDIVEGFRKGMAETLSDEDYDTHYNLGIAYREMGLIDEAIGEFQMAAKDDRYLVECCSLLASCFVDKDFCDLAVQWYARGLESPALDEGAKLGLLYELGTLLAATGEPEAARARFREIYGINSNYRDVVAKLKELSR